MPTADLIARARDALPPDLYRQPAYRGISTLWRDAWDILDADDRVCGLMREDSLSIVRRVFSFWPGRHHLELGGVTVARLTQIFRWIRKEFRLEILEGPEPIDARFVVACALLAVMADVRRES